MLQSITVDNYALIEHLEMSLDGKLNIITGETGAGKSILLGALGLLLGNKNDGSAIKDNAKSCVVEGVFDISSLNLQPLFSLKDWDWETTITIRRVISPSGKSRSFVGDIPATLVDVKELGSKLIDIHSQHQNQLLSSEQFRIESIDLYAQNMELLSKYEGHYSELTKLKSQLQDLQEQSAKNLRDQEWLSFQVEELEGAKLTDGEDKALEQELQILENSDRIGEALSTLHSALDAEEVGVLSRIKGSLNDMRSISSKYSAAEDYAQRLESVLAELKDIDSSVEHDIERVEADPERLQRIGDRLGMLYSLCQKHRAQDLAELIAIRDDYSTRLELINNSDEQLQTLRSAVDKCQAKAMAVAKELESKRKGVVGRFEETICQTLSMLGMAEATIKVDILRREGLCATGCNSVDFLFSSNKNATPQPIDKIASGGEVSRVMLSLKSLVAQHKQLPTIIFDEIDTGVSGHIADAMGGIISALSESLQVVDITHLAQVAAKGDTHFVVYKEQGRTNIKLLTPAERVTQIAQMISGAHVSDAAVEQAKILLS